MSIEHPPEEDLVMYFYRESDPAEREKLQAHLEQCGPCRAAYQRLEKVLAACDELPVPEPHLAFESRMWNRIEPQLHPLKRREGWWESAQGWLNSRWMAAAAVAAMLLVAFFAGRFTRPSSTTPKLVAITADGSQRVLLVALGDHLERSQMVLTELANSPNGLGDSPLERERARTLVSENRMYRQTSAEADPAMAQVLDELERVLLDISHGTDTREIKARIDSESLLFKLRVLGGNLNRTNRSSQSDATPRLPSKETL
jgi:hypothetical protein